MLLGRPAQNPGSNSKTFGKDAITRLPESKHRPRPMRRTIHFVYPHRKRISCPDAIGYHVANRLRDFYTVKQYEWTESVAIRPSAGDVLLGHPHPAAWTVFRKCCVEARFDRVIIMSPYNGDRRQVAFIDRFIHKADLYLAITGNYWFERIENSAMAHWRPKMRHLDLAVHREDFPPIKRRFGPPGKRRYVFIGHSGWQKNTRYLSEIAARLPFGAVSWAGNGKPIANVAPLGYLDFSTQAARSLIGEFDFMLTAGRYDANPATILEAMAWGIIPVCTQESGYGGYPGIVNIPLDDAGGAARVLEALNELDETALLEWQKVNWELLGTRFSWERFVSQIVEAIEDGSSPPLNPCSKARMLGLRYAEITSPYLPYRPYNLARDIMWRIRRRASRNHVG